MKAYLTTGPIPAEKAHLSQNKYPKHGKFSVFIATFVRISDSVIIFFAML
jgi:membrane protein DedA with SNARE-associated domain